MSKIDANVAVVAGDISRPPQTEQDRALQRVAVQRSAADHLEHAPVAADDVGAAAAQLQQVIEASSGRKFTFKTFKDSKDVYLEIRDSASNELIRQIPSEEILNLRESFREQQGGGLFDGKA